jgi:tetratricopeptide (TPR) repeat protein
MTTTTNKATTAQQKHDDLLDKMEATRRQWNDGDDDDDDDDDQFLQQAIDMAIQQGKGWSPGEKEEYMKRILDDDYIPPIFCSTPEELERSGLADAFAALQSDHDDDPAQVMMEYKKKGTDAFLDGKRNQVHNVQYYRDAINHYYEAIVWANKIEPMEHRQQQQQQQQEVERNQNNSGDETTQQQKHHHNHHQQQQQQYTEQELNEIKSTLYSNSALCHMQLKNWGFCKKDSNRALTFHKANVKAWYRLAKAHQMLQEWEEAGNAIDSGLQVDQDNTDLIKLSHLLHDKIRKARVARQKRERIRAERVAKIKQVWQHCGCGGSNQQGKEEKKMIKLGRVPLVASVSDEDDYDDTVESAETRESRWHHHFPHTGILPTVDNTGQQQPQWTWPCLFLYPSHSQSDFVKQFAEDEMLAIRMAEMFPEVEEGGETVMPWDYNQEFQCSKLAVYFEVNCPHELETKSTTTTTTTTTVAAPLVHPDFVERLLDQASTMRFYEASRALKGDEGPEMANLAKAVERKRLQRQRKAWKRQHGSLWAIPDPCPSVRVHPAMTLYDILTDPRMVVANFVVTLVIIPEDHPAHAEYLKEHPCIGILQPTEK